ncbi:hypothetical protein [Candidatus Magnetaquiglobus chichijimensis]|uniref:hypothetical protein n=1 Tax=Candidatus Magnetaquiglobus chichijimensis TaxID=3141448 RepID=UPI003B9742F3
MASALDADYLRPFRGADVVYSWGVLHHTGNLWQALENVADLPRTDGGRLFIALYNDQGWVSRYWTIVKRLFNKNGLMRWTIIVLHWPYLYGLRYEVRLIRRRIKIERGMSMWRDMLDWLGGYPFEVTKPEEVFLYLQTKGYRLVNMKTCGGRMGCNEFVLVREPQSGSILGRSDRGDQVRQR